MPAFAGEDRSVCQILEQLLDAVEQVREPITFLGSPTPDFRPIEEVLEELPKRPRLAPIFRELRDTLKDIHTEHTWAMRWLSDVYCQGGNSGG